MKILLDTCEFLWLVSGDPKLSAAVSTAIRDPNNQVSPASHKAVSTIEA
jgi:PIN domain nuclease of toxin-antitoxin system